MECSVIVRLGHIISMGILALSSTLSLSLTHNHARLKCNFKHYPCSQRKRPRVCVYVMRTLTYGFRRRLVRTLPPWLFCVHCLRKYSPYTRQQIISWLLLLLLLLILCKFSIFDFIFPKIVVIFFFLLSCYVFYCDFHCLRSNARTRHQNEMQRSSGCDICPIHCRRCVTMASSILSRGNFQSERKKTPIVYGVYKHAHSQLFALLLLLLSKSQFTPSCNMLPVKSKSPWLYLFSSVARSH